MSFIYRALLTLTAAGLVFSGCKDGIVPFSQHDASSTIELTSPYIWTDASGQEVLFNVNQLGLSIKQTLKLSDGTIEIQLGGVMVVNGTPEALHGVPYPDGIVDILYTDFPVGSETVYYYPLPVPFTRRLENNISLGGVSKNSKYTVVTISGIVPHSNFVNVREENESLRLLTDYYVDEFNYVSVVFNRVRSIALKNIVFHEDPNFFTKTGALADTLIFRGNKGQKGGFNVLIWDDANPKRASLTIQDNHNIKKVIIDWNNVNFVEMPLTDARWENTQINTVNRASRGINIQSSNTTTKKYTASAVIMQYKNDDIERPEKSVAEGLSPVFTPVNSTEKVIYFQNSNGVKSVDGVFETNFVRFELADRVKISAIQGRGLVDNDKVFLCIELPPDPGSITPKIVELELSVTVIDTI